MSVRASVYLLLCQAGRSHMKHLMADLEVEQEKCAGLAAALDGELAVDAAAVDSNRALAA